MMIPAPTAGQPYVVCLATPPGRSAIATVLARGPQIAEKLECWFRPASGQPFSRCQGRSLIYGTWISPPGCSNPASSPGIHHGGQRTPGEDLVIHWRDGQTVAIHCHGGQSAGQAIIDCLRSHDFTAVSPTEFARLLNDNPWSSDLHLAITRAPTSRTAKILLQQYLVLPQAIERICALIGGQQTVNAAAAIQSIFDHRQFGRHLTEAWCAVLCGRPNVGKSSLSNRLLGYQRSIVHAAPGTARDVLSQMTALNGWPVEIKDTAGLRVGIDQIEQQGTVRAWREIRRADLVVAVFDATQPWTAEDDVMLQELAPQIVVHNKIDLCDRDPDQLPPRPPGINTSAISGSGITQLVEEMAQILVPALPAAEQPLPVCQAQVDCLATALSLLDSNQGPAAIGRLRNRMPTPLNA